VLALLLEVVRKSLAVLQWMLVVLRQRLLLHRWHSASSCVLESVYPSGLRHHLLGRQAMRLRTSGLASLAVTSVRVVRLEQMLSMFRFLRALHEDRRLLVRT
jgi:hypothetical protein